MHFIDIFYLTNILLDSIHPQKIVQNCEALIAFFTIEARAIFY